MAHRAVAQVGGKDIPNSFGAIAANDPPRRRTGNANRGLSSTEPWWALTIILEDYYEHTVGTLTASG